jgi:hypothetical protein
VGDAIGAGLLELLARERDERPMGGWAGEQATPHFEPPPPLPPPFEIPKPDWEAEERERRERDGEKAEREAMAGAHPEPERHRNLDRVRAWRKGRRA